METNNKQLFAIILIFLLPATLFQGIGLALSDDIQVGSILGFFWSFAALGVTSFLCGRVSS